MPNHIGKRKGIVITYTNKMSIMKSATKLILFRIYKKQVELTHNFKLFEQVRCTYNGTYHIHLIDWEFYRKITGAAHLLYAEDNK